MSDALIMLLGVAVLLLFGLWRNAVERERLTSKWAAYLERDRERTQASLCRALGIDEDVAEDDDDGPQCPTLTLLRGGLE